jgi:molecular chaperone HscC
MVIPASRSKMVGTTQDGQRLVRVLIWQGESRQASQNLPLGRLDIPVPPKPKNEVRVDIRYTYDVNGILDVDVEVLGIGITRNLVIHELAGDVSDEEIARRRVELAALRVHPREQEPNRLVLERADRLYEQLLGAEREQVRALITQFEGALARQDPHEIEPARAAMSASLDSLERGPTW